MMIPEGSASQDAMPVGHGKPRLFRRPTERKKAMEGFFRG
jgi:hypothetical protein